MVGFVNLVCRLFDWWVLFWGLHCYCICLGLMLFVFGLYVFAIGLMLVDCVELRLLLR